MFDTFQRMTESWQLVMFYSKYKKRMQEIVSNLGHTDGKSIRLIIENLKWQVAALIISESRVNNNFSRNVTFSTTGLKTKDFFTQPYFLNYYFWECLTIYFYF